MIELYIIRRIRKRLRFNCVLSDFKITIHCSGNDGDTFASITNLTINDNKENIFLSINYKEDTISFKLINEPELGNIYNFQNDIQVQIKIEIDSLRRQINNTENFNEVLKLQYDLTLMEQKLKKVWLLANQLQLVLTIHMLNILSIIELKKGVDSVAFRSYIDDFIITNKNYISVIQDKKNKLQIQKNTIVDMKHFDQHSSRIINFLKNLMKHCLKTDLFI